MAKRIPFKVLTTAAVAATVGAAAFVPAAVANSEASFSISEVVVEKDGKNFSLALDTYLLMKGADHEFVTKEDGGFINPSFVKSSTGKVFKLTDFISARGATDDGAIEAALELLDANEELAQEVVAGSVTVGADGELDIKDPVVDPDPDPGVDPDPVTELAVESVMAINGTALTDNTDRNVVIQVTFNQEIDEDTVNSANFRIFKGDVIVSTHAPQLSRDNKSVTLRPTNALDKDTEFKVEVTGDVKLKDQDVTLGEAFTKSFKTNDKTAVTNVAFTQNNNTAITAASNVTHNEVLLGANVHLINEIDVTFSEGLNVATISPQNIKVVRVRDGAEMRGHTGVKTTYNATTRTVKLDLGTHANLQNYVLTMDEEYKVVVSGLLDTAGNEIASFEVPFKLAYELALNTVKLSDGNTIFSTVAGDTASPRTDVNPLLTSSIDQTTGQVNKPGISFVLQFNTDLDQTTLNSNSVRLMDLESDKQVEANITYNATTNIAVVTPKTRLKDMTPYRLIVSHDDSIIDLYGNALSEAISETITTVDETPPTVVKMTPQTGSANVAKDAKLVIEFSERMDRSSFVFSNVPTAGENNTLPAANTLGLKDETGKEWLDISGATDSWSADGKTLTLELDSDLAYNRTYTLVVKGLDVNNRQRAAVNDINNVRLVGDIQTTFAVVSGDTVRPTVEAFKIAGATAGFSNAVEVPSTNVRTNRDLYIGFSELLDLDPSSNAKDSDPVGGLSFNLASGNVLPNGNVVVERYNSHAARWDLVNISTLMSNFVNVQSTNTDLSQGEVAVTTITDYDGASNLNSIGANGVVVISEAGQPTRTFVVESTDTVSTETVLTLKGNPDLDALGYTTAAEIARLGNFQVGTDATGKKTVVTIPSAILGQNEGQKLRVRVLSRIGTTTARTQDLAGNLLLNDFRSSEFVVGPAPSLTKDIVDTDGNATVLSNANAGQKEVRVTDPVTAGIAVNDVVTIKLSTGKWFTSVVTSSDNATDKIVLADDLPALVEADAPIIQGTNVERLQQDFSPVEPVIVQLTGKTVEDSGDATIDTTSGQSITVDTTKYNSLRNPIRGDKLIVAGKMYTVDNVDSSGGNHTITLQAPPTVTFLTTHEVARVVNEVDPATVTAETLKLMQGTTAVNADVQVRKVNNDVFAVITPLNEDGEVTNLSSNTTYTVSVTNGVKDTVGNAMRADDFNFKTSSVVLAPKSISVNPTNGSIGFDVTGTITVQFDQPISKLGTGLVLGGTGDTTFKEYRSSTGKTISSQLADAASPVSLLPEGGTPGSSEVEINVRLSADGKTLTIKPTSTLDPSQEYILSLSKEIGNAEGTINSIGAAGNKTYSFVTSNVRAAEVIALGEYDGATYTELQTTIADNALLTGVDKQLVIVFDEDNIDVSEMEITFTNLTTANKQPSIRSTGVIDAAGTNDAIRIRPTLGLESGSLYSVKVEGVKDFNGTITPTFTVYFETPGAEVTVTTEDQLNDALADSSISKIVLDYDTSAATINVRRLVNIDLNGNGIDTLDVQTSQTGAMSVTNTGSPATIANLNVDTPNATFNLGSGITVTDTDVRNVANSTFRSTATHTGAIVINDPDGGAINLEGATVNGGVTIAAASTNPIIFRGAAPSGTTPTITVTAAGAKIAVDTGASVGEIASNEPITVTSRGTVANISGTGNVTLEVEEEGTVENITSSGTVTSDTVDTTEVQNRATALAAAVEHTTISVDKGSDATSNQITATVNYADTSQVANHALLDVFKIDALINSNKEFKEGTTVKVELTGVGELGTYTVTEDTQSIWLSTMLEEFGVANRTLLSNHITNPGKEDVWVFTIEVPMGGKVENASITVKSIVARTDDRFNSASTRTELAKDDVTGFTVENPEEVAIEALTNYLSTAKGYSYPAATNWMDISKLLVDGKVVTADFDEEDEATVNAGIKRIYDGATIVNDKVTNADGFEKDAIEFAIDSYVMNTFARYLGALERETPDTIAKIVYDGNEYTWRGDASGNFGGGSNWRDENLKTLVSAILDNIPDRALRNVTFEIIDQNDVSIVVNFQAINVPSKDALEAVLKPTQSE